MVRMSSRIAAFAALFLLSSLLAACGDSQRSKGSGGGGGGGAIFEPPRPEVDEKHYRKSISRIELGAGGGGSARSNGLVMDEVTVGGNYLQQLDVTSQSYTLDAGLHGNPRAIR